MSLTDDALRKLQREGFFAVGPPATTPKKSEPRPPREIDETDDTVPVESLSEPPLPTHGQQQEPPSAKLLDSAANETVQEPDIHERHAVPALPDPDPPFDARAAYDPVIPSLDDLEPPNEDAIGLDSERDATAESDWLDGLEPTDSLDESEWNEQASEGEIADVDPLASMPARSEIERPDDFDIPGEELSGASQPAIDLDPVESFEETDPEDPADLAASSEQDDNENEVDVIDAIDEVPPAAANQTQETYEQTLLQRLADPTYAQPFHHFQQNLLRTCGTELPDSLLVVSPSATARSAETVCHLALIWEQAEDEILLIDANLEQQALTRAFHAVGQPGLCDLLGQQSAPEDVVRCTSRPRLHFIPSGDDRFGISRVPDKVDPQCLADLLQSWCRQYQRVFIDCGSMDSLLMPALAELCDASLLVVCLRDVTFSQLEHAAERLRASSRRVLGCVLTDGLTDLSGQS